MGCYRNSCLMIQICEEGLFKQIDWKNLGEGPSKDITVRIGWTSTLISSKSWKQVDVLDTRHCQLFIGRAHPRTWLKFLPTINSNTLTPSLCQRTVEKKVKQMQLRTSFKTLSRNPRTGLKFLATINSDIRTPSLALKCHIQSIKQSLHLSYKHRHVQKHTHTQRYKNWCFDAGTI